ncbi:MAG: hypothetical protein U5M51_00530 [Emticicia sp.]|nr:hypothetical protein [Emticicia sp.]
MGYSNFKKIKTVVKNFNLELQMEHLFTGVNKVEPSPWLIESLIRAESMPSTNEKTKAERIISPILLDVYVSYSKQIAFFSGENIDIDSSRDLAGECDFFFSLQSPKPYIEAPIISIAEAKDEDMEWGLAQCAAQIYGASLFNELEGKKIDFIYGCATDGFEWKFIRFEKNKFTLDYKTYTNLNEILGVWHHIINLYL